MIEVGYATAEDCEPARLLLKATAERLVERLEPLWPPHEFTSDWIEAKRALGQLVVGKTGGALVGVSLLQYEDEEFWPDRAQGQALYMHRICAAPGLARGSWPNALFDWAEGEAQRLGRAYLRLDCFPRPKLRAVYESAGFEKVDARWVHYLYVYRYERAVRPL